MRVYKEEVKLNPWASRVTVSRTRNGRWIITRGSSGSELPADTFENWDHAEWTGNAWANEEYERKLKLQQEEAHA